MHLQLARMTRDEVTAQAPDAVAVVPVGSTEQHGPHLPMITDTFLVESVLGRALESLSGDPQTYVQAPSMPYGCSDHHLFAAAVSLRIDTLRAVLADVCDSLVTSGFRRIVLVNGHGGNDECVGLAVKELVLRHEVSAAACSYWNLPATQPERPERVPGHAGWFETSMMLAASPELAHTDRLTTDAGDPLFDQSEVPGLVAQRGGEWARVGGVTDPSADASAESGEALLHSLATGLADALRWFARQQPPERTAPTTATTPTPPTGK